MKNKMVVLFSLLFLGKTVAGFTENFTLNNQSSYPNQNQKSKIAIQWASSAREVDEENHSVSYGMGVNPQRLQIINQTGDISLTIPEKEEYFRVIVWSKGEGDIDFVTNWIDIVPNKTYTLKADHLVPVVLMAGTGC